MVSLLGYMTIFITSCQAPCLVNSLNAIETFNQFDGLLGEELCITGVSGADIVVLLVFNDESRNHKLMGRARTWWGSYLRPGVQ